MTHRHIASQLKTADGSLLMLAGVGLKFALAPLPSIDAHDLIPLFEENTWRQIGPNNN
jgi:hypothetical protein